MDVIGLNDATDYCIRKPLQDAMAELQNIGSKFQRGEYVFNPDDVTNIDELICLLREKDKENNSLRDKIETESILVNMLRNQLGSLPAEVNKEIDDAVLAARSANEDEIQRLQQELKSVVNNIDELNKKTRSLELENASLIPERQILQKVHDDIILQLNKHMSVKAGKQIDLNETRDKVRQTNQEIVDLEESMVMLKQALIKERADARRKKEQLNADIESTTVQLEKQNEKNEEKKKNMDGVLAELKDSEDALQTLIDKFNRLEDHYERLEDEEESLEKRVKTQILVNKKLVIESSQLREKIATMEEDHALRYEEQQQKIAQYREDIGKEVKKDQALALKKVDLAAEVQLAEEQEKAAKDAFDEIAARLNAERELIAAKAKETGSLRQEADQMQIQLSELLETHQTIVEQLEREIEDLKIHVMKERQERLILQEERDRLNQKLERTKHEHGQYIVNISRRIKESKERHEQLLKKGASLQKMIKSEDAEIQSLKDILIEKKKFLLNMKKTIEDEIASLSQRKLETEAHIEAERFRLTETLPPYQELRKIYEGKCAHYDALKKELVAKRNKEQSLAEQCSRLERDISNMERPKAELEKDLQEARQETIKALKEFSVQVERVEKCIYSCMSKIRIVSAENQFLGKAIEDLSADLDAIKVQVTFSDKIETELQELAAKLRALMQAGWAERMEFQHELEKRDTALINSLRDLHYVTQERGHNIGHVTDLMKLDIENLDKFLKTVSRGRINEGQVVA